MPNDFPDTPTLTDDENSAILKWGNLKPEANLLTAVGNAHNVGRHASVWGMKLFAALIRERPDLFTPGCDPIAALNMMFNERCDSPLYYHGR